MLPSVTHAQTSFAIQGLSGKSSSSKCLYFAYYLAGYFWDIPHIYTHIYLCLCVCVHRYVCVCTNIYIHFRFLSEYLLFIFHLRRKPSPSRCGFIGQLRRSRPLVGALGFLPGGGCAQALLAVGLLLCFPVLHPAGPLELELWLVVSLAAQWDCKPAE